jgi:hypothetical protein
MGIPNGVSSKFYPQTNLTKGLVSDVDVRESKISIKEAATADEKPISSLLLFQLKDLTGAQLDEFITSLVDLRNENKTLVGLATTLTLTVV